MKEIEIPQSLQPFSNLIKRRTDQKTGQKYLSSCSSCLKNFIGECEFTVVDAIPDCIKNLQNYNEKKALALGAFFCRTFHPDRRKASFAHVGGHLNCGTSYHNGSSNGL
jgi:hypothetical protein